MWWREDPFEKLFRQIIQNFFKDIKKLEKDFKKAEKPPKFTVGQPEIKRSGFSIHLYHNGKHPPEIEIKRFGPRGWTPVPVRKAEKIALTPEKISPLEHPETVKTLVDAPIKEKPLPEVKTKIIPNFNVSVNMNQVTITIDAKGVESKENVKVKFYPESVEVTAIAPKLQIGYFITTGIPTSVDQKATTIKVTKNNIIVKIPRTKSTILYGK